MWVLLSAVVVCFTIIVLFRMYIDLKRVEYQHGRLMADDQRAYERFVAVSGLPHPKPSLPDFGAIVDRQLQKLEMERAKSAFELKQLEARYLERTYPVGYHVGNEPWIDPAMTELMRRG
ncbi:MAG TPA: hypothetical protein VMW08_11810 [Acidimicrobiales bacterium]|nr:hypothetical protein [Acidimicrobiales bacterium]